MKTGTASRRKVITMVLLMAIAIILAIYNFKSILGGPREAATVKTKTAVLENLTAIAVDADSRLNLGDLERSRSINYQHGRNVFEMLQRQFERSEGVRSSNPPTDPIPQSHPASTIPSIPLVFYGFTNRSGDRKKVFLQQQDSGDVFIASQGDVIDRRYRVVQVQPDSVLMEDLLTNNRQPVPLTAR